MVATFICILYSNPSSQEFINRYDTGAAIMKEIITRTANCFESKPITLKIEAPITFLTPISFDFWAAVNDASPIRPRQAIKIANPEKIPII